MLPNIRHIISEGIYKESGQKYLDRWIVGMLAMRIPAISTLRTIATGNTHHAISHNKVIV